MKNCEYQGCKEPATYSLVWYMRDSQGSITGYIDHLAASCTMPEHLFALVNNYGKQVDAVNSPDKKRDKKLTDLVNQHFELAQQDSELMEKIRKFASNLLRKKYAARP